MWVTLLNEEKTKMHEMQIHLFKLKWDSLFVHKLFLFKRFFQPADPAVPFGTWNTLCCSFIKDW